jgi:hypothetical protein
MLTELHNIRRLLISPSPENVRVASAELEKLPSAVNDLAGHLLANKKVTYDDVKALMGLRSEILSILLLLTAALDYFTRLRLLRATGFSDYERTGALRPLEMDSRTIGQL